MTGKNKRHLGVTRSRHQTASSRDEFAGFFGIFEPKKGSQPSGTLGQGFEMHANNVLALVELNCSLSGSTRPRRLPELVSECPVRFPKRLLKPLGLRVSLYEVKCPTSDCDKHALCRLQVAPLYLLDPTIKAPRVRARKDQRWQNCSMV